MIRQNLVGVRSSVHRQNLVGVRSSVHVCMRVALDCARCAGVILFVLEKLASWACVAILILMKIDLLATKADGLNQQTDLHDKCNAPNLAQQPVTCVTQKAIRAYPRCQGVETNPRNKNSVLDVCRLLQKIHEQVRAKKCGSNECQISIQVGHSVKKISTRVSSSMNSFLCKEIEGIENQLQGEQHLHRHE